MAYDELAGDVKIVKLGGVNKEGKKNPMEVEGYLQYVQELHNKFNPSKPQKFYVLKTRRGLEGIYGKGGLDKLMSQAVPGLLTKIVDTGETKDTGKGNPMKVYKVFQDKDDSAEVMSSPAEDDREDSEENVFGVASSELDEPTPIRGSHQKSRVVPADASSRARTNAILGSRSSK